MSSVADRVREHRARKKSGVVLITIAADEAALASALVDAKLLDHNLADDQRRLRRRHRGSLNHSQWQKNEQRQRPRCGCAQSGGSVVSPSAVADHRPLLARRLSLCASASRH
jgi:hypothetical protein